MHIKIWPCNAGSTGSTCVCTFYNFLWCLRRFRLNPTPSHNLLQTQQTAARYPFSFPGPHVFSRSELPARRRCRTCCRTCTPGGQWTRPCSPRRSGSSSSHFGHGWDETCMLVLVIDPQTNHGFHLLIVFCSYMGEFFLESIGLSVFV